VVSGDYNITVQQGGSGPNPQTFRAVLNGERITIVAFNSSEDPRVAESSRRVESQEKITSGRSGASSAELDTFDEIITLLYDDMGARLKQGLRIALLPLVPNAGFAADKADYITDNLTVAFINSGKFDMLERQRIDQILREQNFQLSGNVDDATAVAAGKLLGADAVMFANIDGTGNNRRIVLRALEVNTGRILGMTMEML
jgi:hypothetical protein